MNWNNSRIGKTVVGFLLTMMLVLMTACGANSNTNNGAGSQPASPPVSSEQNQANDTEKSADETVYPLTVKDASGVEVTFEKAPERVITLVPSETETIFAIGSGDNVVGVDEWSNYPEEAASITKIGDMASNIEAVTSLNPDLVLASTSMNADALAKLRELNITVYATNPKTYDEVIAKIETIGTIMNRQSEANAVAEHMRNVKQQVSDAVKDAEKKSVYLEFSPGWTVGSGEFLDELITLAGGTNIAAGNSGWYQVSAEEVISQNPQLIIYPNMEEDPNPIVTGIESRPGWNTIDAVKNKHMYAVTNDPLVRVGPRLADGLLELAKVIHPDLVK